VKTPEGEGIVDGVEILKEQIKVKFRDGDEYYYKKYGMDDIKIIKNVANNKMNKEEQEHLKELQELQKLEDIEKNERW